MGEIFVFGSNLAGRHGKGAAREAWKKHGAKYRQGVGRSGNSYAIPTKNASLETLDLKTIQAHVGNFLNYARLNAHLTFRLTPIGCGLAGYSPSDIAPMFRGAPANVIMPAEFHAVLETPL